MKLAFEYRGIGLAVAITLAAGIPDAAAQRNVGGHAGAAIIAGSDPNGNGDGATMDLAFRAGRLYERWGLDVELSHALRFDGKLESDAAASPFRIEDRHTAFTIAAFWQQEVTPSVTIGYVLGGYVATRERDVSLTDSLQEPTQTRRVEDALTVVIGPALGLDARIALSTSLRFAPSARVLIPIGGGGVLVRTTAGLQWMF